ncbi:MAG: DUF1624 domain-containing protein [Clostridia bacterium]
MAVSKNRIWELDAFRGLFILCVVFIHTIFDLQIFGFISEDTPLIFNIIRDYGGILFILISGICVTLGSHCFKRGMFVFLCGMAITLVTYTMYRIDPANKDLLIHFGILHLLGLCMMLYPLFRKLPVWAAGMLGILFLAMGFVVLPLRSDIPFSLVIGIIPKGYVAADYFPVFPNMGWFLLGSVLGRTVYKSRQSLMPRFPYAAPPVKFFSFCGRHSLWIYMLHQPVIYGIVLLIYTIVHK